MTNKTIIIDGVEKDYDSLTDQQKGIIAHVGDLDAKINQARFQLDQLAVARDAFVSMLNQSLKQQEQ